MNFLNEIVAVKKEEIRKLRLDYTLDSFRDMEYFNEPVLSLKNALERSDRLATIAEIKKASPSRGIISQDFNALKIAGIYQKCGVDAISVLTDRSFFKGGIEFLNDISAIKTLPLLRKDFIMDVFQVFEAKANGADAILLISEILSAGQIAELTAAAVECRLEVLLEIHSASEVPKIDFNRNNLIGINNRDLFSFTVDLDTTVRLSGAIPGNVLLVSESGIGDSRSVHTLKGTNVKGLLVGEHFMRAPDLEKSVRNFLELCSYEG